MTNLTQSGTGTDADRALKAKHRAMWAFGDYTSVSREVIPHLGLRLVEAAGIGAGDHVLDVAAGDGNATIPAVEAGAHVIASDLTPELLEKGREEAGDRAGLSWREADAEALPFEDAAFDKVISCVGVMFAPHHEQAAAELLRVTRPGGTIALASWTPEGFIGQMFATMKPFVPAPPPGVQPPPLWGREEHVQSLLGDGAELTMTREQLPVTRFSGPEDFREFFKAFYGPTIAAYKANAEEPKQVAELDRALAELADRYCDADGNMEWEYLLVTARRT
jgi:SAM-dependent methyltransferase